MQTPVTAATAPYFYNTLSLAHPQSTQHNRSNTNQSTTQQLFNNHRTATAAASITTASTTTTV